MSVSFESDGDGPVFRSTRAALGTIRGPTAR